MLGSLMLKEFRLQRLALIAAVGIVLVTEPLMTLAVAYFDSRRSAAVHAPYSWRDAMQALYGGSIFAVGGTGLFAAVFAGAPQTVERRERWSEFAAMLPIRRGTRALIALGVALMLTSLYWMFNAAVMWFAMKNDALTKGPNHPDTLWTPTYFAATAAFSLGTFGLAWLASSFMRSAALLVSIIVGLSLSGLLIVSEIGNLYYSNVLIHDQCVRGYLTTLAILGVFGTIAGTVISTRRVVP